MIKVILDKKDLSMVSEDLQNEDILTKQIDMDKVELIVDDGSFDILERIIKKITVNSKAFIFETHSGWVKLLISDMLYIESFGSQIVIHTVTHGNISIKQTLYQLENLLRIYHIIRIGKSFLVNLSKVVYIHSKFNSKLELELMGGIKLEVTRGFIKSFKNALGIGGIK